MSLTGGYFFIQSSSEVEVESVHMYKKKENRYFIRFQILMFNLIVSIGTLGTLLPHSNYTYLLSSDCKGVTLNGQSCVHSPIPSS